MMTVPFQWMLVVENTEFAVYDIFLFQSHVYQYSKDFPNSANSWLTCAGVSKEYSNL